MTQTSQTKKSSFILLSLNKVLLLLFNSGASSSSGIALQSLILNEVHYTGGCVHSTQIHSISLRTKLVVNCWLFTQIC